MKMNTPNTFMLSTGLILALFSTHQVLAQSDISAQAAEQRTDQVRATKAVSPQPIMVEKKSDTSASSTCSGQGCDSPASVLNPSK